MNNFIDITRRLFDTRNRLSFIYTEYNGIITNDSGCIRHVLHDISVQVITYTNLSSRLEGMFRLNCEQDTSNQTGSSSFRCFKQRHRSQNVTKSQVDMLTPLSREHALIHCSHRLCVFQSPFSNHWPSLVIKMRHFHGQILSHPIQHCR